MISGDRLNRRDTILALLAIGIAPLTSRAQPTAKVARILVLSWGTAPVPLPPRSPYLDAFNGGLRELGYIEGTSFIVERRWTLDKAENVADLVKEIATFKPDVILATGELSARAAKQAAPASAIVLAYSADPVAGGFAKSLARPAGNVTGIATLNQDTSPKLLELLLTVVPKLPRVAVLANPTVSSYGSVLKNLEAAAQQVQAHLQLMEVRSAADIDREFARIAQEKVKAVVVLGDPLIFQQRRQIGDLALKYQIASVYPAKEHVEADGLMSYGVNIADGFRRAASYVDKILKGAKPGDLPIQQATTFELVINLKTAKALGITIPRPLLLRADRVIE